MIRTRRLFSISNVHKNKAKNMHKMGGGGSVVKIRKAVCIQAVKVHVLCSGLRDVSESSTTPAGTAWMF